MNALSHIRRFIALDMHITACNLHCEYCYVPASKKNMASLPDYGRQIQSLGKAFSPEKLGGVSFIYLYANGEPLLHPESGRIISELLVLGHYVGVVSNLTHVPRVKELCAMPTEYSSKLVVLASLHYTELKKRGLLGAFFDHVRIIREHGASCIVRLCLAPQYLDVIEELRQRCLDELGELPVVTHYKDHQPTPDDIEATLSALSAQFPCTLYKLQKQIVDVKRTEFCHAGEWSYAINFCTGDVRSCLMEPLSQNVYDGTGLPLKCNPVGRNCRAPWCTCGAHFLSWGVIEEFNCPHYADMLSCHSQHTLSEIVRPIFSHKLSQDNR